MADNNHSVLKTNTVHQPASPVDRVNQLNTRFNRGDGEDKKIPILA